MELKLNAQQTGQTIVLQVEGSVSEVEVYRFSRAIRDLIKGDFPRVAIDISKIDFMASHALGILVSHFYALQKQGREMVLINHNPDTGGYMNILLESTRLNEMIRIITPEAGG